MSHSFAGINRNLRRLRLGLMSILFMASMAHAQVEEHGARFAERVNVAETPLVLAGTGVAKYRIIFTVYAAGLYVPEQTAQANVLDVETPRRLEIEYFHNISAEEIIEAADIKLGQQLSADVLARLTPKIEQFHALFQAVSDGDRYRMDYQPGLGTELSFNGEPVGRVAGDEFASAYFGIWLDADNPLSDSLRRDLLANTVAR